MQRNHAAFARSAALRASLNGRLVRQAIAIAGCSAPDMPDLIQMARACAQMPRQRLAQRLKGRPGVIRVAMAREGRALTRIARAVRIVDAGDECHRAATPGRGAGGHDKMALDPDCRIL